MEQQEKVFADGFIFKRNEKAPEFVVGRLSVKIDDAVAWMKENQTAGWVNLNIKTARSGNYYVELDTFKPTSGAAKNEGIPRHAANHTTNGGSGFATIKDEGDLPF